MKKAFGFLVVIIIVVSGFVFYSIDDETEDVEGHEVTKSPPLPTEEFISQFLLRDDGSIMTNFTEKDRSTTFLSESTGLWMEYLIEKGDLDLFLDAFHSVNDLFLLENSLIAWQVDDGELATTNALIDDLRIIEALFMAGEMDNNQAYIALATEISEAVLTYNRQDDAFIDFYDLTYEYANEELTLSYLIPGAFSYMVKYNLLSKKGIEQLNEFMEGLPKNNGFYPKYYHVTDKTFLYDETINLIDQLYTVIHLERFSVNTDEFYDWVKSEFYKNNILYGRYDRQTKVQAVGYEAAAVYALAMIYSLEKGNIEFAKDLSKQLKTMQITDEDSDYFGGYLNISELTTHPFDNLLPLLAERKLMNEQTK